MSDETNVCEECGEEMDPENGVFQQECFECGSLICSVCADWLHGDAYCPQCGADARATCDCPDCAKERAALEYPGTETESS